MFKVGQLWEANRAAARVAVIFGEEELARQACSVKQMASGKQAEVPLARLVGQVELALEAEAGARN